MKDLQKKSAPRYIKVLQELDATSLMQAAALIQQGGVVVYPTETVYGIGCNALHAAAVQRIFSLKQRDGAKPLPVIAANSTQAVRMIKKISLPAQGLMDAFWPGPLTLIVPAAAEVPPLLHAGTHNVGIRVSSGGIATALCEAAGVPLVATSANRSGEPSALSIDDLPAEVCHAVDLIIDSGRCSSSVVSTIVDMVASPPRVVRSGAIPHAAITSCLEHLK